MLMRGELGEEHPSQRDQHVQKSWGKKELGVCEDLKDKQTGAVSKGIGGLRRLESGWWSAIHCQPMISVSDMLSVFELL